MNVKNLMEDIVFLKLEEMIGSLGICKCDQCKSDVAAFALNHLQPRYYSTEKGGLFIRLEEESNIKDVEVMQEIARGAQIVKGHPRHEGP